ESTLSDVGNTAETRVPTTIDASPKNLNGPTAQALPPASFFHSFILANDEKGPEFRRSETARSIGLAYDSLHRIQAVLAYLHIVKHRVPGISQFLDEAKHTYVQALARFSL